MEARPEFTVIAGPNGAGKSRLSPYYIYIKKSAKHEVTNHGIKWFNMFFADYFKNL